MREFHAFSTMHGVVIVAMMFVTAIACAAGVRWRGSPGMRHLEQLAAVIFLTAWLATMLLGALPPRYSIGEALPLQMCDLTGLFAPLVLLTSYRPLRTLLYFWGLGLSVQAVITPTLEDGPARIDFWMFWIMHAGILGTAAYDVIARRYRPTFRDAIFAIVTCAAWLVVVLTVDLSLDVNYGYVGKSKPTIATPIDHLGPWPLRVYKMSLAAIVLLLAMWLPWGIAARRRRRAT
jgi:hypothetical integral membrane protein (TIGR02206 family)